MSKLIAEYQRLLAGPESLLALDQTLTLVEKATGLYVRVRRGSIVVMRIPGWVPPAQFWKPLSSLTGQTEAADDGQQQSLRREAGRRSIRLRVLRTKWCLMTLSRHLSEDRLPNTQHSFTMDCLLLLFHQAYFALLPKLEEARLAAERNELISTFLGFSERLDDVAERFRIAGLAYEAQGDAAAAVASFEKALTATHVDEHVFMTRLQTFWMSLLDKGDFTAALHLLLRFMSLVSLKQLPELRELVLATFRAYGDACSAGRAAG